jgi:hypothetical protein
VKHANGKPGLTPGFFLLSGAPVSDEERVVNLHDVLRMREAADALGLTLRELKAALYRQLQ